MFSELRKLAEHFSINNGLDFDTGEVIEFAEKVRDFLDRLEQKIDEIRFT